MLGGARTKGNDGREHLERSLQDKGYLYSEDYDQTEASTIVFDYFERLYNKASGLDGQIIWSTERHADGIDLVKRNKGGDFRISHSIRFLTDVSSPSGYSYRVDNLIARNLRPLKLIFKTKVTNNIDSLFSAIRKLVEQAEPSYHCSDRWRLYLQALHLVQRNLWSVLRYERELGHIETDRGCQISENNSHLSSFEYVYDIALSPNERSISVNDAHLEFEHASYSTPVELETEIWKILKATPKRRVELRRLSINPSQMG